MTNTPNALVSGTRLQNGAYAVGGVLGQGGFAITYKGGDLVNKKYVAVKEYFPPGAARHEGNVVPTGPVSNAFAEGRASFLNEAKTLAQFQNPSIVSVFGAFEENNTCYLVMEFLEGQSFGQRLASKGQLEEWEVLGLALRLTGALTIIHAAGVLHRDIKPENIVMTKAGRAVLIDFGTARSFSASAEQMTQIVTPGYAPLEQYATSATKGPATDIYALGATLYHALAGERPVAATDRAADVPLKSLPAVRPDVNPTMAKAIMSALELEMARRPQSAHEFAERLQGRAATPALAVTAESVGPQYAPSLMHASLSQHVNGPNAMRFFAGTTRLITAGGDRLICDWKPSLTGLSVFFQASDQSLSALAVSPDGGWIASGGRDQKVRLWDGTLPPVERRSPLVTLTDCQGLIHTLDFCPIRRELLVGEEGGVTLWDASIGSIKSRRQLGGAVVQWSPDGKSAAIGSLADGTVQLCDGESLAVAAQFRAHNGGVSALAYAPDGGTLATAGLDGFVRVWNLSSGARLWEKRVGPMVAPSLAWSPDGRLLASASLLSIFLWTAQGDPWRRIQKHKTNVGTLAFAPVAPAPSRYLLASGSSDKAIDICSIKCEMP